MTLARGSDADTVFQLASLSKPIGTTVVAHLVGTGSASCDTPARSNLRWFALLNLTVSEHVTVLFASLGLARSRRRSAGGHGIWPEDHSRAPALLAARAVPRSYFYTNRGLTGAADLDWATRSERTLYPPLGMMSTSLRYGDFIVRTNRATVHVNRNGQWGVGFVSKSEMQSPAGGVSASAIDISKWLTLILGNVVFNGKRVVDANALTAVLSPESRTRSPGAAQGTSN